MKKKLMDYACNYLRTKYPNYIAVATQYTELPNTAECPAYFQVVAHSGILFMNFLFYINIYGDVAICDKQTGKMGVAK